MKITVCPHGTAMIVRSRIDLCKECLKESLTAAVMAAINSMGLEAFKRASFFGSNNC